jgi:hypothetical protein
MELPEEGLKLLSYILIDEKESDISVNWLTMELDLFLISFWKQHWLLFSRILLITAGKYWGNNSIGQNHFLLRNFEFIFHSYPNIRSYTTVSVGKASLSEQKSIVYKELFINHKSYVIS